MRPASIIIVLGVCLAVAYSQELRTVEPFEPAPKPIPPLGIVLDGVIPEVVDSDTVEVLIRARLRVRFTEMDGPEQNTPEGKKATQDLKLYAEGQPCRVYLKWPDRDDANIGAAAWTFERWLGSVWKEGDKNSLGDWQIKRGNVKKENSK